MISLQLPIGIVGSNWEALLRTGTALNWCSDGIAGIECSAARKRLELR
jgi:hypothetical protein